MLNVLFSLNLVSWYHWCVMETADKQELFDYYNERAPEYEEFYDGRTSAKKIEPALIRREITEIKEIVPDYVNGRTIDIACGTGYWLPYYHRNCPRITLVDQSENVLNECREKIAGMGISDRTEVVRADIFSHRYAPQQYDSALTAFLLSHFTDAEIDALINNLRGSLAAGGRFVIIDNIWNDMVAELRFEKYGLRTRYLKDGRHYKILKRFFDQSDLESLAVKHGFRLETGYYGEVFFLASGAF